MKLSFASPSCELSGVAESNRSALSSGFRTPSGTFQPVSTTSGAFVEGLAIRKGSKCRFARRQWEYGRRSIEFLS